MPTKKVWAKKREEQESNITDDALTLLGAGDYRPLGEVFYLGHNAAPLGGKLAHEMGVREFGNSGPERAGGMILKGPKPKSLEFVECVPIRGERLRRLRVMWRPLFAERDIPAVLYTASAAVVDRGSGKLLMRHADYRHLPPDADKRNGTAWFPFPIRGEYAAVPTYRATGTGEGGMYQTGYRYQTHGNEKDDEAFDNSMDAACAMSVNFIRSAELAAGVYWSVSLGFQKEKVRVKVFTDAEGVTGFFNMREKGSSGRRDALRHWVRAHSRRVAGGSVAEVKRHLRGQYEFEWFGMVGMVSLPGNEPNDAPGL